MSSDGERAEALVERWLTQLGFAPPGIWEQNFQRVSPDRNTEDTPEDDTSPKYTLED